MKRAFLWGCLLPVLAACAGGGESRGEGVIFPDPVPVEGKVRLSSILSRYRLIPLQTGDSSLVGAVVKVVKNDGRYYVSDRSDQLSVFDAQGRFLGRIAGRGAGRENTAGFWTSMSMTGKWSFWTTSGCISTPWMENMKRRCIWRTMGRMCAC